MHSAQFERFASLRIYICCWILQTLPESFSDLDNYGGEATMNICFCIICKTLLESFVVYNRSLYLHLCRIRIILH